MDANQLDPDEVRRRGDALYEDRIRPIVESGNAGRILVLDLQSGEYEIGDDDLVVSEQARRKHPNGTLYAIRIAADSTYYLGTTP